MSLRRGPSSPRRRMFEVSAAETIRLAHTRLTVYLERAHCIGSACESSSGCDVVAPGVCVWVGLLIRSKVELPNPFRACVPMLRVLLRLSGAMGGGRRPATESSDRCHPKTA